MAYLWLIPVIAITVTLLVRAELRGERRQVYLWKPLSTVLVIAVAVLSLAQPNAIPAFTLWVTCGLVLSLGGDVALILESARAFLAGLVLFLLAHVVYAVAFTLYNGFHAQDLITAAILGMISVLFYLYLWPGLGRMKVAVAIYVLFIATMVNRALSTFFGETLSTTQAWLISIGAILFMVSDMVLAVNRFRHPFKANRLGLYFYYGGQLLIALSTHYFVW
jgi:uncharacterized membrane protein YhhN